MVNYKEEYKQLSIYFFIMSGMVIGLLLIFAFSEPAHGDALCYELSEGTHNDYVQTEQGKHGVSCRSNTEEIYFHIGFDARDRYES